MTIAHKKGIPRHKRVAWVKRRAKTVYIHREKRDGHTGCSTPCVLCRNALIRCDLKVCFLNDDHVMCKGKMDSVGMPTSKLTSGQKRLFGYLP